MAENILIDFVVNDDSLAPAIDKLTKLGLIDGKLAANFKQTNSELTKQAAQVKSTAGAWGVYKNNLNDVSNQVKQTSTAFTQGFEQGVMEVLEQSGVSLDQFLNALKNGPPAAVAGVQSIRSELGELTETIARAKANGEDYGESYDELVQKAGRLKDAIGDINQEIGNVASDTSNIDGLVSAASGVAGAFSLAQGAAALFGDESEELQETLLRVNAAMAIAQGLQQVQQVLQKESAASRLADVIATKAQTVAQTAYNFVVGTSTGLLKAFRIALATTGVGLLVIGLIELYNAFTSVNDAIEDVNSSLEKNKNLLDADLTSIQRRTELELARARSVGAAESELIRIRGRSLIEQRAAAVQAQRDLINQASTLDKTTEEFSKLNTAAQEYNATIDDFDQQILLEGLNLTKQVADEQKQAAEDAKKQSEELRARQRANRDEQLQDVIAGIERQLLAVEEGSQQELDLRKKLIVAKANLDLNQEGLTQNEIKLIQEQSFKDRQDLQKEFDAKLRSDAIAAQIARNEAELSLIKTNNDDRLILQLANIELAAQQEIDAANGNAAVIKEIIARRDAEIRDTKKRFIDEAVEYEISLSSAQGGSTNRALQRIIADEKAKKDLRIRAANELAAIETSNVDKRLEALNSEYEQKLINDRDYNLKYAQLQDEKAKISESTEKQITDIVKSEDEKRKAKRQAVIQAITDVAQATTNIIQELGSRQTEQENQRIERERERVQDQLEAGQITEREAIARNKRLEVEEKQTRIKQAQRDKQIALFKAIVNTALAVTNAITTGDPYTAALRAAIVAAIGAAEIAVIASRPIPTFAKGKKQRDTYEGLGEIAEAGPELIERDGQLYLAPKRTIVHIKSKDVIHTAGETRSIFQRAKEATKSLFERSDRAITEKEYNQQSWKVTDYSRIKDTTTTNYHDSTNQVNINTDYKQFKDKEYITYKEHSKDRDFYQEHRNELIDHRNELKDSFERIKEIEYIITTKSASVNNTIQNSIEKVLQTSQASRDLIMNSTHSEIATNTLQTLEKALQSNSTEFFNKVVNANNFLETVTHKVDRSLLKEKETTKEKEIDYDKMGQAYAKYHKGTSINIEKDFISEAVNDGLSKNNYFTKRYSSNI